MPRACAQAVSNNADGAVVQALLDAHPSAVRELDARGYLPLHLAAQHGACGDVVHRLLFAYHDAAWTACGWRKDLPIHLAVERTAPSAVIDYLLEKYPEAWKRYNKYSTRAEAMGDKKLLLPGE